MNSADVLVVILAGGKGTRLASVLDGLPKPMAPIAGRPFLEYEIELLKRQGFRRFLLLTGYRAEKIQEHFGNGQKMGVDIRCMTEESPLGTGGAVANAGRDLGDEHLLILNGDTYFKTDYQKFLKAATAPVNIGVRKVDDAQRYGAVEFNQANGVVTGFKEKSQSAQSAWINAGVYFLRRQLLVDAKLPLAFSMETDFFPLIFAQGSLKAIPCDGEFIDIGIPESFAEAQTKLPAWSK